MESPGKVIRSKQQEIKQVEVIEFKEELGSEKDNEEEAEAECILPDLQEEDPLRIDNKECKEQEEFALKPKCAEYTLWSADRRKELLKTDSDMSFSEISQRLSMEWEKISINEKYNYRKRAIRLGEPTRQSSRLKKPKEMKNILEIVKNRKKAMIKKIPQSKSRHALCPSNKITSQKEISENIDSKINLKGAVMGNEVQMKKPIVRYTAYSLWSKDVKVVLLKDHPDMSFIELSKQLSKMWRTVSNLEKYNYRRRAKRMTKRLTDNTNSQLDCNLSETAKDEEIIKVSRKGRILLKPTKLVDFCELGDKKPSLRIKTDPSLTSKLKVADDANHDEESMNDSSFKEEEEENQKSKFPDKKSPSRNSKTGVSIGNRKKPHAR